MRGATSISTAALLLTTSACTTILGIDGNYVGEGPASQGGDSGASGGGAGTVCGPTEKVCGSSCVPKDPTVGCGRELCAPCPQAPDNAVAVCVTDYCDVACQGGYVRATSAAGVSCERAAGGAAGAGGAPPSGGSPTVGGSGGSSGLCVPSACVCKIGFKPCCVVSGQCGCEYVFPGLCAPGL